MENEKNMNQPFTAVFDLEDAPDAVGATTVVATDIATDWELVWYDEFEGDTLDESKWHVEDGTNGIIVKKPENVKVENGNCVITMRHDHSVEGFEFAGASISTNGKFSFQYGRLEFRAKLPYGEGVWPALWTLSDYYSEMGDELGWAGPAAARST